jgi:hypothetical protein
MSRSGFSSRNNPLKDRGILSKTQMMVTIAWNPLGFHLLDALPKSNTFNAEYYNVNLLTELLRSARRLIG